MLQILINTKKVNRIKQFPMVPVSAFFVLTSCIFFVYYKQAVSTITKQVPYLSDAGVLVLNALIYLSFMVRKLIARPIITAVIIRS